MARRPADDNGDWTLDALCAQTDPALYFPEKGQNPNRAKATCGACPVIADCLDFALDNRIEHGVWGGASPREREAILAGRETQDLASS